MEMSTFKVTICEGFSIEECVDPEKGEMNPTIIDSESPISSSDSTGAVAGGLSILFVILGAGAFSYYRYRHSSDRLKSVLD